ncbi:uncharacterized protein (TIGR03089 family) [Branchiibius hedensis]|uniref:TIGR03089 family protein n=1 Tax=Branchiibius hedensis TaxID=672460 RepID=A0A2Y8ZSK0_9MICO|nr:TIGR03089 family protein [Branchiibius hedensis]PWJ26053.1 uncharacterized protein (TIGR03089 family) [Branchiibius hedensis]SSA34865.1 TIGR03089 family protein [Branchiibius hedensis]
MIPLLRNLAADNARPRVTYYNDATGERIELSGSTVLRWVNKAANWLQDEMDAGPGTSVHVDLPADHWRAVYWILATWAVGAVLSDDPDADIRIGLDDPTADLSEPEASLAPSDITSQPDAFTAYVDPAPEDLAVDLGGAQVPYAALLATAPRQTPRVLVTGDLAQTLLTTYARDGSVILLRNEDVDKRAARLLAEGLPLA